MKQSDIINGWRQIINPKDADYFKNKLLKLADNCNKLSNDEINNKIEDIANEIKKYRISNKTINRNKINDNFSRDEFCFNKDYFKSQMVKLVMRVIYNDAKEDYINNKINLIIDKIEKYKLSRDISI